MVFVVDDGQVFFFRVLRFSLFTIIPLWLHIHVIDLLVPQTLYNLSIWQRRYMKHLFLVSLSLMIIPYTNVLLDIQEIRQISSATVCCATFAFFDFLPSVNPT